MAAESKLRIFNAYSLLPFVTSHFFSPESAVRTESGNIDLCPKYTAPQTCDTDTLTSDVQVTTPDGVIRGNTVVG